MGKSLGYLSNMSMRIKQPKLGHSDRVRIKENEDCYMGMDVNGS